MLSYCLRSVQPNAVLRLIYYYNICVHFLYFTEYPFVHRLRPKSFFVHNKNDIVLLKSNTRPPSRELLKN